MFIGSRMNCIRKRESVLDKIITSKTSMCNGSKIDSENCNGFSKIDIFSGVVDLRAIPKSNLSTFTMVTLNNRRRNGVNPSVIGETA